MSDSLSFFVDLVNQAKDRWPGISAADVQAAVSEVLDPLAAQGQTRIDARRLGEEVFARLRKKYGPSRNN
jgi:transcriptional regulator NrdR family protein